ncbi:MAG: hypothetical protein SGBAC_012328, partial [Bacillariaceae sp.]
IADTERCNNSTALSIFMSNLLANASKIEIVDDNAKKRAYGCNIRRQCCSLSIRRHQRWGCEGVSGSITAIMANLPQRRKSLEHMESSSSEFSFDSLDDDDDFDDICSNVSLDTFASSFRSCDSLDVNDQRRGGLPTWNMHHADGTGKGEGECAVHAINQSYPSELSPILEPDHCP